MGAFYGSVQVRGEDRESVRAALEELARKKRRKFLLGPALDGWIGVYPDGNGQDLRVVGELARRLPGELVAVLVHDDDIFAYEYYRDGKRVDRYNSVPDYFEEVSEAERRRLRGRPERLAHLASDPARFAALRDRLDGQARERVVFASELLEAFAETLGIRNALTSYEYLKENEETDDVEGWEQFVHVPDLGRERARRRAADAAIEEEKDRLTRDGRLIAERGGLKGWASPSPWWCPSPDGQGFLVAWSSHADPKEEPRPLERHGPPWSAGPATTEWAVGAHVYGLAPSPSGRYLAVAHAAGDWKASLWDLQENRRVAEAPQVRAVTWVGFLPDESAMVSVSSDGEGGRVVLTPVDGGEGRVIPIGHAKLAAVHPSGSWLVVADNLNRLLVVEVASGRVERTRFVGGRYAASALERELAAQAEAALSKIDFDDVERMVRQQQEAMLGRLTKAKLPPDVGSVEAFKERLERQISEELRKMRERFAGARAPERPAPEDRGTEGVFAARFDPSGRWLCLATMGGVRVYPWSEVVGEDGDLPRPALAVDVAGSMVQVGSRPAHLGGFVYDLDLDPDRNRLLFAGLDGRVRFLDLDTGRSGVLLEPPALPPIHRVGLSRDGATLALTTNPDMFARSRDRRGPVLQFWDYRAIVRAADPGE
jgi:WD40 repeat protein